jgi:galactonate dehydratase
MKAGYRAFQAPAPPTTARNQGQAFDRAARARMDALRSAGGSGVNFVLDAGATLMAGDAASLAASLEPFHLLWLNEPCPATNLKTIRKISDETVTPLGFGRDVREASAFQDLLREGVVDILRPDLHRYGISRIRQIATLAETYYVAVAPHHDGGPIATAAALHLAASLPNFFIQHIPWSAAEADRRMREELVSQPIEAVRDGFAQLPGGIGLGIEVNEKALEKYREASA